MGKLILKAQHEADLAVAVERLTGGQVLATERWGSLVTFALGNRGLVSALVGQVTPLASPLPEGENVILSVQAEGPSAPARVTRHITSHLTPTSDEGALSWRRAAQAWQERLKQSASGETLLGEYPDAEGLISYNPVAKALFAQDARRYLKRVLKELGWDGKVSYNEGGIAVSGEATLRAASPCGTFSLFIEASCSYLDLGGSSPSGVTLMYRLHRADGTPGFSHVHRNRFLKWSTDAVTLARLSVMAWEAASPETHLARGA